MSKSIGRSSLHEEVDFAPRQQWSLEPSLEQTPIQCNKCTPMLAINGEKNIYGEHFEPKLNSTLINQDEKWNPSYRRIEQSLLASTYRSALGKSVLNDKFKLAPPRNNFVYRAYNKHELTMFTCSDEQDELDMEIGRRNSMKKGLQEYIKNLTNATDRKGGLWPVEKALSVVNMRIFKDMYGKVGDEQAKTMLKKVNADASEGILKVLIRVSLEEEELINRREAMKKDWAKVYKKHHKKSLDHLDPWNFQKIKRSIYKKKCLKYIL